MIFRYFRLFGPWVDNVMCWYKLPHKREIEVIWLGAPIVAQQKRIRLGILRLWVQSLASLSGLCIWHCHELWSRSQMWLRSCVAVAVEQAGSCSSDSTPSLGTSTYCGCGPRKQNKQTNKQMHWPWKWNWDGDDEEDSWDLRFEVGVRGDPGGLVSWEECGCGASNPGLALPSPSTWATWPLWACPPSLK